MDVLAPTVHGDRGQAAGSDAILRARAFLTKRKKSDFSTGTVRAANHDRAHSSSSSSSSSRRVRRGSFSDSGGVLDRPMSTPSVDRSAPSIVPNSQGPPPHMEAFTLHSVNRPLRLPSHSQGGAAPPFSSVPNSGSGTRDLPPPTPGNGTRTELWNRFTSAPTPTHAAQPVGGQQTPRTTSNISGNGGRSRSSLGALGRLDAPSPVPVTGDVNMRRAGASSLVALTLTRKRSQQEEESKA